MYTHCPRCGSVAIEPTELNEFEFVCLTCNKTWFDEDAAKCDMCRSYVRTQDTAVRPDIELTVCNECYKGYQFQKTNHYIDSWLRHEGRP